MGALLMLQTKSTERQWQGKMVFPLALCWHCGDGMSAKLVQRSTAYGCLVPASALRAQLWRVEAVQLGELLHCKLCGCSGSSMQGLLDGSKGGGSACLGKSSDSRPVGSKVHAQCFTPWCKEGV